MNFLGLDGKAADLDEARVGVVPAPYEATCTYGSGASKGPEAIIRASEAAEFYDETVDLELDRIKIATLAAPPIENMDPEQMVRTVYETARTVTDAGKLLAGLGGEHTVTLGFLQAALEQHPKLSVLQIDAHPDLRNEYENRKFCHATVGRRIMDAGCRLIQVGLRAFSREEFLFIEECRANHRTPNLFCYSADFISRTPDWIEKTVAALGEEVYVTLDLDGLDPSVVPHTGTPEPGGLSWWEICDLLARTAVSRKIIGFDIVELAPTPSSRISDFTAARLCMRLIALALKPDQADQPPRF